MLIVDKLSMRFGGLAAVNAVDLRVEPGQIFSVIGPNGAGKTTAFNAITGIYEPTGGTIKFAGRELRRPFTWRVALLCIAVGIFTSLAAMVASVNVDGLWRAVIKRNYDLTANTFDRAAVWQSLRDYLRGELAVERQRNIWSVVRSQGAPLLGPAANRPNREAALALRDDVEELIDSGQPIAAVNRDNRYAILSADGERILVSFVSADLAHRTAEELSEVRGEQRTRRATAWLALVLGLAVGAAGTWVVWNRARRTPDIIALAGIARTFQNIRLFGEMTVLENVLVALDRRQSRNPLRLFLRTPAARREETAMQSAALESLRFVGLEAKAGAIASSLAYGDQRRLEIARALATEPQLLLLDEPAAGMNPSETGDLTKLIRRIRDRGVTVLLIEHHMNVVMGISDRIAVLDYGQKIAEGTPDEVRRNPKVIEAYLGKEDEPT